MRIFRMIFFNLFDFLLLPFFSYCTRRSDALAINPHILFLLVLTRFCYLQP